MSKKRDTRHMHFELTPEQYRAQCEKAKLCGLSKRALLVRCIEGTKPHARPSEELKKLRLEVHYIGVNINQIARSVNARISSSEDAKYALYLLDKVYELLRNAEAA